MNGWTEGVETHTDRERERGVVLLVDVSEGRGALSWSMFSQQICVRRN